MPTLEAIEAQQVLAEIHQGLLHGQVIPYLGPGVLALSRTPSHLPETADALVAKLTAKTSVPHKIRRNLTAAAQFIENFKHRRTVCAAMNEAFAPSMPPTGLHAYLASLRDIPLWVHLWYDPLPQKALTAQGVNWGLVQGVSQAEHHGEWVHFFDADGKRRTDLVVSTPEMPWSTLLYQPMGSISPAANYLVSDSDYVEVLTEIDIQSPIPASVQKIRADRHFLFLGCRFAHQMERIFAQQIIKRSSQRHWAVLPEEPTRNEKRFLDQFGITRIDMPLAEWTKELMGLPASLEATSGAR